MRDFPEPVPGGIGLGGIVYPDEAQDMNMPMQMQGGAQYIVGGDYAGLNGPRDHMDMTRQVVMAALPMLQSLQEQGGARARTDRARELDILVGTLGSLKEQKDQGENVDKIQKRVDALIEAMERRSKMTAWYLPTFYGDIRLESQDPKVTRVVYEKLTPRRNSP